jgi:hypothetical protein
MLNNNLFWQNESYYVAVGGLSPQFQQNVVSLYNSFSNTLAGNQTTTGSCTQIAANGNAGAPTPGYWDIGVRGDTGPSNHNSGVILNPVYSLLTDATDYPGANNLGSNPNVVGQYCTGSRQPPEACSAATGCGWATPPGISDATVPNPIFNLTPVATVDEGNNWINMRFGPLSLTNPTVIGGGNGNYGGGAPLGNYAPNAGSPAIDYIPVAVGVSLGAPSTDFFGNPRPAGAGYDIGAVEFPELALSPNPLSFGNQPVLTPSATKVLTLSNPAGGLNVTGIAVSSTGANAADYAVTSNCGTSLAPGAQCTISVTFTPSLLGPRTATVTVTDSEGTQTASLTGTGTGPLYSVNPGALSFPNTVVSTASAAQQLIVRNNQTTAMSFTAIALNGLFGGQYATAAGTTCAVGTQVASGATCVITVTFNPQTVGGGLGGIRPANLTMTAAGLVTNVPLSGTAILYPVDVTPKGLFGTIAGLVYPNTQIGQFSAPLTATLSNYQSTPVTVNSITMPSQFRIVTGPATTCTNGAVLPPAAANGTPTTCTVAIQFVPTAPGMFGLWIQTATFNLSGSQNINPPLILFGGTLNSAISGAGGFGNQQVGATSNPAHVFTYRNSGATAVTIGAAGVTLTGANAGNYALVNNLCAGATVAAGGGTCTVGVTFTPSATGSRTATLNVNDGVGNQTFGLNGTGVQAAVSFTGPAPAMNGGGLSTKNGTITVHNTGTAALTLSSTVAPTIAKVGGLGTGTATIQSGGSCALGTAVAAGGACTISVRWVPTNTSTANLAVTITDTGAATPAQTSGTFPAN